MYGWDAVSVIWICMHFSMLKRAAWSLTSDRLSGCGFETSVLWASYRGNWSSLELRWLTSSEVIEVTPVVDHMVLKPKRVICFMSFIDTASNNCKISVVVFYINLVSVTESCRWVVSIVLGDFSVVYEMSVCLHSSRADSSSENGVFLRNLVSPRDWRFLAHGISASTRITKIGIVMQVFWPRRLTTSCSRLL